MPIYNSIKSICEVPNALILTFSPRYIAHFSIRRHFMPIPPTVTPRPNFPSVITRPSLDSSSLSVHDLPEMLLLAALLAHGAEHAYAAFLVALELP